MGPADVVICDEDDGLKIYAKLVLSSCPGSPTLERAERALDKIELLVTLVEKMEASWGGLVGIDRRGRALFEELAQAVWVVGAAGQAEVY